MIDTTVRVAELADWLYVDALRKREGDALGFIPKDRYVSILGRTLSCGRARYRYERVWVAEDNGDTTGFLYAAFPANRGVAKVWQVCVQEDARRWHRALLLLDEAEREAGVRGMYAVEARVALDLDANHFWLAAGYAVVGTDTSTFLAREDAKSRRLLVVYRKTLTATVAPQLWAAS